MVTRKVKKSPKKPASKPIPKDKFPVKEKHGGAPSKFEPRTVPIFIGYLARQGKTIDEIAAILEIGRDTLYRWKKERPEIESALKENQEVANAQVVESIFKRAVGYNYTKTEIEVSIRGGKEHQVKKEIEMHVPADMVAAIFYITNRDPARWKRNVGMLSESNTSGIDALMEEIKKQPPLSKST